MILQHFSKFGSKKKICTFADVEVGLLQSVVLRRCSQPVGARRARSNNIYYYGKR